MNAMITRESHRKNFPYRQRLITALSLLILLPLGVLVARVAPNLAAPPVPRFIERPLVVHSQEISGTSIQWIILMNEGFENSIPTTGWCNEDRSGIEDREIKWGTTEVVTHTGRFSAWCAAGGTDGTLALSNYPPNLDSWLIYGPFSLEDVYAAELQFSYRNESEDNGDDFFAWAASPDGVNFYGTRVSGGSPTWQTVTLDLSAYAGDDTVWVAFYFHSDDDTNSGQGAFVDDVLLRVKYYEHLYIPLVSRNYAAPTPIPTPTPTPAVLYDDFSDDDPVWNVWKEESKDGTVTHANGRLKVTIQDNSATIIAWPGWRPQGDFKLEVDAYFDNAWWMNGLGLVFGGSDDWKEYYELIIAYNPNALYWGLRRFNRDGTIHDLRSIGGGPNTMNWKGWNHLIVIRQGVDIYVYGYDVYSSPRLLGGPYRDSSYGSNRLVGLVATSFEGDEGGVLFDNFRLTPLNP